MYSGFSAGENGGVDTRSLSMPPSPAQQRSSVEWLLSWTWFPTSSAAESRSGIAGGSEAFCSGVCRRCALHIRPLQSQIKATNVSITHKHLLEHRNATRLQSFVTAQACFHPLPPQYCCQCVVMNSLILSFFIKTVISEINVLHLQLLNLPRLGQLLE